ncbi:plasmolipin [Antennarius striatus]|uniref:plasmolipin n=1 Tax=Antennarius striatus TaxID=241820 RepID=UPI0035B339BC
MADFPSKVNTETSSHSYGSEQGGNSLRGLVGNITTMVDVYFAQSIPAILMMIEIFLGMLHWALIASTDYTALPVYGWVMFVAVTTWILTTILYLLILCGVHRRLTFVPWPITVMLYYGIAVVLYLTAFLANAATVNAFSVRFYNYAAAASFFGAMVTLAYGTSAFLSYLEWKGDGGNAATSTVPT